jgi:hypothetical protein
VRSKKPSLTRRLTVARASVDTALEAFEAAAVALEAAADEAADVVTEAEVKVQELTLVRDDAYRQSASYRGRADKIREFVK